MSLYDPGSIDRRVIRDLEEMTLEDELLTNAIILWTGWGRTPTPAWNDDEVVATVGDDQAPEFLGKIRALADDFYSSNAINEVRDLAAMGRQAAAEFAQKHPEIGRDAVRAFEWCYTYDFK